MMTSFNKILIELAEKKPNYTAIRCGKDSINYKYLVEQANHLAHAYQCKGVSLNDFVIIALPNSIEFFVACVAIWKLGATPLPVSNRLPTRELQAIVELANPALIIGVNADLFPEQEVIPAGFTPEAILTTDSLPQPDLIAKHWKAVSSGGSTGRPKLIVSTMAAELDVESESVVQLLPNGVVLIPGPLHHNGPFAMAMEALLRGNQIVVMKKFDALETLRLIDHYRVDWTVMVPTMMHRVLRLPTKERERYDLSSLRVLLHIAAPCSAELKQAWIDWLGAERIYELYGGTENYGSTWIRGDEWLAHKGSVGKLLSGCRLKIIDEDGNTLPAGEAGEVYFLPDTGQGSTYHYLGAEPLAIEGGWESLGDIGYLDEEGYLYLCDRKKDMILSGGANIYPAEVEAAIESHPAVRSCLALGIPNEDLGQQVHALVDAPSGITKEVLCDYLSDQLVRYKIPRSFEFVDSPLRDDAGKARRSALAQERSRFTQCFSRTVPEATQKFIAACQGKSRGHWEQFKHPLTDPSGQTLYTSVGWIGRPNADNVILLVSGTHGSEGWAGSAIMIDSIRRGLFDRLPADTAVMMIHLINPWGCAWGRRENEDNCDLFRDLIYYKPELYSDDSQFEDEIYAALTASVWSEEERQRLDNAADQLLQKHGELGITQIMRAGQFRYPDAPCYNGGGISWSFKLYRSLVASYLNLAKRVLCVDIHTGFGAYGDGILIPYYQPDGPDKNKYQFLTNTYGAEKLYVGGFDPGIPSHPRMPYEIATDFVPDLEMIATGLEFGTYEWKDGFNLIKYMNYLFTRGDVRNPECPEIVAQYNKLAYPDTDDWRDKVIKRSREVMEQTLDGMARWKKSVN
ncbi:DUF2817 domain-containing protein [Porticoccaceae bacterium]|nr:DUF2817 domain-containing protein [Porticoccaceae bacterium]